MKVVIRASLIGCLLMTLLLRVYGEDGDTLPSVTASRRITRGSNAWTTGVWGSWSMWSACSRTCGRGVSIQTRECVEGSGYIRHQRLRQSRNHGSKSPSDEKRCLGISRRVQLCKIEDCKFPVDIRKELCLAFNDKPFRGRYFKWEPYFKDSGSCELRCQPIGERFFATLAKVVEDGTPCGDYNDNDKICVSGECKVIGCDGIIGSNTKIDHCGVCGGENTTCRRVVAYYTNPVMPLGYNSITVIPSGATNINVTEFASSRNVLALKTADDDYFILNGNWSVNRPGDYIGAGTVFRYRRSDPWGYEGERISAQGPTDRPVELLIVYQQRNRGIAYSYSLPVKRQNKKDSSARKGSNGGSGYVPSSSVDSKSSVIAVTDVATPTVFPSRHPNVKDSSGSRREKNQLNSRPTAPNVNSPVVKNSSVTSEVRVRKNGRNRKAELSLETAETSSVNSRIKETVLNDVSQDFKKDGAYLWRMTGFGPCSEPCGKGLSHPMLKCLSKSAKSQVPDFLCNGLPKPIVRAVVCNKEPCTPKWTTDDWSSCSVSCGDGFQVRKVYCAQRKSPDKIINLSDDLCAKTLDRPAVKQHCTVSKCAKWKTSPWSMCTADCGKGTRTRKVTCVNNENAIVDDSSCPLPKPEIEETCFLKSCAGARWIATEWRRCSSPCETGTESRKVICLDGDKKVHLEICDRSKRPDEVRPCQRNRTACRKGSWFAGPWSQCSSSCGPGSQTREVLCLLKEKVGRPQVTDDSLCSPRDKPVAKQKCDNQPCDDNQWYAGEWSTCTKSCDGGRQTREVFCLSYGQSLGEGCSVATKPSTAQSCNTESCQESLQGDRGAPLNLKHDLAVPCTNQWWSNCNLVVQARLCSTEHYRVLCCYSCEKAKIKREMSMLGRPGR